MENEIQFYLDDDGGLWKKEGTDDYYFSRKSLEWIKAKIVFILPSWDDSNVITENAAEKIIDDYKADGKLEDEEIPVRYFGNDNDFVFAEDIYGNEFYVLADMSLKPADKGTIDLYWGGLTKEEAKQIVEKEYGEGKWILTAGGNRLIYGLDDYDVAIYVNETDPETKTYKTQIILDDGMGTPAAVAYLEADTVEELKKKAEDEINSRVQRRNAYFEASEKQTQEWVKSMKEKMAKGEL